ncbi:MAG: hypothetical protein R3A79_14320 [Nannocystaceae bacterium]
MSGGARRRALPETGDLFAHFGVIGAAPRPSPDPEPAPRPSVPCPVCDWRCVRSPCPVCGRAVALPDPAPR